MSLLSLAKTELGEAEMQLTAVQFVACGEPLDAAAPDAPASLWVLDGDRGLVVSARGKHGRYRKRKKRRPKIFFVPADILICFFIESAAAATTTNSGTPA